MSKEFKIASRAPSNIAFIKYWGKRATQIPINPSLSMTLNNCYTDMEIEYSEAEELKLESFLFEGNENKFFKQKIEKYLNNNFNFAQKFKLKIKSSNSFPHSAGIASSASSMAALCFGLGKIYDLSLEQISHYSRLASGSACRSVYPQFATWGESSLSSSSNEYATPFDEFHQDFAGLQDSILIVSGKEKKISSTQGHALMQDHPYLEARKTQAHRHFEKIVEAMIKGDFKTFGNILENEALSLHALMMSSLESFTLLEPNSLKIIEKIRDYRQLRKTPLYFTIDAGPNIHLIYPEFIKKEVLTFIEAELKPLCENGLVIHDEIGNGPQIL